MPKSRSAEAKGINFRGLLDAIAALHGPEAQRAVIAACGGEVGPLLERRGLTAGAWYDVAWYRELHACAQRTLRRSDIARECARWAIQRDLSGIYRVLLFLLTPDSIISKCPRIMQQYWRGGVMRVPLVRDGMAAVEFAGWSGFDQNVWQDIMAASRVGSRLRARKASAFTSPPADVTATMTCSSKCAGRVAEPRSPRSVRVARSCRGRVPRRASHFSRRALPQRRLDVALPPISVVATSSRSPETQ